MQKNHETNISIKVSPSRNKNKVLSEKCLIMLGVSATKIVFNENMFISKLFIWFM